MGVLVFRVVTILAILAAFTFAAVQGRDATEANRQFTCSIADLVTIGGGAKDGVKGGTDHAQAELDFLTNIRDARCDFIESHPAAKRGINHAIRGLERRLEN